MIVALITSTLLLMALVIWLADYVRLLKKHNAILTEKENKLMAENRILYRKIQSLESSKPIQASNVHPSILNGVGMACKILGIDNPFKSTTNEKSLKEQLQIALDNENFEEASRLRDLINKSKES